RGLKDERRPPADPRGDQPADQWSRCGANAAQPADRPESPGPRGEIGEPQRREDVDGRNQQRSADAPEAEFPQDQYAKIRDTALRRAPTPYSVRPKVKHRFRPQRS